MASLFPNDAGPDFSRLSALMRTIRGIHSPFPLPAGWLNVVRVPVGVGVALPCSGQRPTTPIVHNAIACSAAWIDLLFVIDFNGSEMK